jgi:hypothetical protein
VRLAARLVLLAGGVAIGLWLFRASPREVKLVYDVSGSPGATSLEVEVRRGGEVMRRAEFRLRSGERQVHHGVRLPDGDYVLALRTSGPSGVTTVERPVEIRESGTIVLSLGP